MFRDVFARRARAEIICVQESERVGELDACVDLPGYRILKSFAANGVCSFISDELFSKLVLQTCASKFWQLMVFEFGANVRVVIVNLHVYCARSPGGGDHSRMGRALSDADS